MNQKHRKPNCWLNEFARNVTSQKGEDGIIEKVLEVVNNTDKWCVEFGSWDGRNLSNTYNLIVNKGYGGVLIECNQKRFKDLLRMYDGVDRVISVNAFVGFGPTDCLDRILADKPVLKDFDLLSIDIDGNDYHVWEAVVEYKPKVVVIEFNPTIPSCVEFVQPKDHRITQGSSLLSLIKLAEIKGYKLVASTQFNAVFVASKYYSLFEIEDNSIDEIWTDQSLVTHLFCGFDGTIFLRGCGIMPWHQIRYRECKVQQIPSWARTRDNDPNFLRRCMRRWYMRLIKKTSVTVKKIPKP